MGLGAALEPTIIWNLDLIWMNMTVKPKSPKFCFVKIFIAYIRVKVHRVSYVT